MIQSSSYGTVDPIDNLKKKTSILEFIFTDALINDLELIKKLKVEVRLDTPNPINGINYNVAIPFGAFIGIKLKTAFQTKTVY